MTYAISRDISLGIAHSNPEAIDGPEQGSIQPELAGMNRREFMAYSFGAATALMGGAVGMLTYSYLMPRFKDGDFGGAFNLGTAETLPPIGDEPILHADGKFWLVNTDDGPKALYTVCTHLGCLYKWDAVAVTFKCPCHASQFDREGNYLEGPASRSLDQFTVSTVEGQVIVDTGAKIIGERKSTKQKSSSRG